MFLPDGDMPLAVARERGAVPVFPAFVQPHSGHLRHEIQLRWPDITERTRALVNLPFPVFEVMRDQALIGNVVLVHAPVPLVEVEDDESLSRRKLAKRRDSDLDDEAPARFEMRGRVTEAGELRGLRSQVFDRVEHEVSESEGPRCLDDREVTDRYRDVRTAGLGSQAVDHRARQVDPVDVDSAGSQWKRESTGA